MCVWGMKPRESSVRESADVRLGYETEGIVRQGVSRYAFGVWNRANRPYDANGIYNLWGLVMKAYKREELDGDLHEQDIVHTLAQALKGAIFMEKTGRLGER